MGGRKEGPSWLLCLYLSFICWHLCDIQQKDVRVDGMIGRIEAIDVFSKPASSLTAEFLSQLTFVVSAILFCFVLFCVLAVLCRVGSCHAGGFLIV